MSFYGFLGKMFSREKSVIFVTLHKCATTFFASKVLPAFKGRVYVDYQLLHYRDNGNFNVKIRRFGYIYGPVRILDELHPTYEITNRILRKANLRGRKIIFLVRDPRDILVSMYYSFGFSHSFSPNREIKEYQVKRRQKIRQMTIDEYALQAAHELKEKFDIIYSLMQYAPDKILLKYEDMIENFAYFYSQLYGFVQLNEGVKEMMLKQTRPRKVEQQLQHKRKGKPGNYKEKFQLTTINKINKILAKPLRDFCYQDA